ncbi:MAG: hypothetical protein AD742_15715 [Methylibium sp. NZG]|nr:MAG: hypothetical protein AD742_15715 [Methylibium sp. NZG]
MLGQGLAGALAWATGHASAASDAATQPTGAPHVDRTGLPSPGTYALPVIRPCPDGLVLNADGRGMRLRQALGQRLSVLSFMYTYCRDPVGCPLAYQVMTSLHRRLLADPTLGSRAQLVSLSFDPTHDTPQQMALYGRDFLADKRVRWQFLTTASVPQLLPLLDALGQEVTVETDARGRPTRTLNHMLKLFLIDPRRQVREIYSVGTLDEEVLYNDLKTLALEAATS